MGIKPIEIPEGWREITVEALKSHTENALATGPFGSSIGSRFFQSQGVPVIRGSNLSDDSLIRLDDSGLVFISEAKAREFRRSAVYWGDLIFTCWGTINQVCLIDDNAQFSEYIISNKQMKFTPDPEQSDSFFLYYLFSGPKIQNIIRNQSIGSSVPGFNLGQLRSMKLIIPPLIEQQAIADALSEVDAQIVALDDLIAKKHDIKQGAMQRLLTGEERLPGFSGEWEVKILAEVCHAIIDGTHYTPKYVEDGIPFYSVENVTANNFTDTKFISADEHARLIQRCKPEKGDILLTRIGSLGITRLIDWDVNASIYVSLALLKPNKNVDQSYLYCYSKSKQFVKDVEKRSLVNAAPQKINMGEIGSIPMLIPADEDEQQAIAAVLSDMDAEISALEEKREKTVALKQGMMQELLTGKTRLI